MTGLFKKFLESAGVCTDTRKLQPGQIFFALSGPNFNGNTFAEAALKGGASLAVVSDRNLMGEGYLVVDDPLLELQKLATEYRKSLGIPLIAIAGSNGKTTTKELMGAVLKQSKKCFVTVGNLNNHIGLPLSILSISRDDEVAVIEMGANQPHDYELLCAICLPDYGLITNIGKDHLEGFGGMQGVFDAHMEFINFIASANGTMFVNGSDRQLLKMTEHCEKRIFYNNDPNEWKAISSLPYLTLTRTTNNGKTYSLSTRLTGVYNMSNIAAACAIGEFFGIEPSAAHKAVEEYVPSNNRSQVIVTKSGNTVLADCYNANPSSTDAALRNLAAQNHKNAIFVLGDMLEMGEYAGQEHFEILQLAMKLGLKGYTVGPEYGKQHSTIFPSFETTQLLKMHFELNRPQHALILLKGSRGMALEKLLDVL